MPLRTPRIPQCSGWNRGAKGGVSAPVICPNYLLLPLSEMLAMIGGHELNRKGVGCNASPSSSCQSGFGCRRGQNDNKQDVITQINKHIHSQSNIILLIH